MSKKNRFGLALMIFGLALANMNYELYGLPIGFMLIGLGAAYLSM